MKYLSFIFFILFFNLFLFFNRKEAWIISDYPAFYTASSIVASGEVSTLYDLNTQRVHQSKFMNLKSLQNIEFLPFRWSPIWAFISLPFYFIPVSGGYLIFVFLNSVLLYICLNQLSSFLKVKGKASYVLGFLFLPCVTAILFAQNAIVSLFFLINIYILLVKQKSGLVGVFLSLLIFNKIQYILFLPFIFFLIFPKKDFLKGFTMTSAILILPSMLLLGVKGLLDYPKFLMLTETPVFGSHPQAMFSFVSFLQNMPLVKLQSFSFLYIVNLLLFLLAFIFFLRHKSRLRVEQSFIFAILVQVVFSIHVLPQDISILLLPILLFFKYYLSRGSLVFLLF